MGIETPKKARIENYEQFLSVQLADISREELHGEGIFSFAVTPEFTIFVTKDFHEHLFEGWGVDPDRTLTEGQVRTHAGQPPVFRFKADRYQPTPGFRGSTEELRTLQQGVRKVLTDVIRS